VAVPKAGGLGELGELVGVERLGPGADLGEPKGRGGATVIGLRVVKLEVAVHSGTQGPPGRRRLQRLLVIGIQLDPRIDPIAHSGASFV
jgi:hypothetical protein